MTGIYRNALSVQLDERREFPEQTIHFRLRDDRVVIRVSGANADTGRPATLRLVLDADQADALEEFLADMRPIRSAPKGER